MRNTAVDQGHVRALAPFGTVQCGGQTPHCIIFFKASSRIDAAMELAARQRFIGSPFFGIRKVRCDVEQGVMTLSGQVASFYSKQVALATARQITGVEEVRDELQVRTRDASI